jgi:hypothetical protein
MSEVLRRRLRETSATLFGTIAAAGLCASATSDLQELTLFYVGGAWALPGFVLLGALVTLVINDALRSALALVIISVAGATLFGLAIAAPGVSVEGVRVTLIDRGTTYGLVGMLLIALFGLCGMVLVWITNSLVRPGSL